MTEPLHEAVRAVIEYDRIHPASGGLRTRLDHLFNVWNAEALDAARKASRGSGLDVEALGLLRAASLLRNDEIVVPRIREYLNRIGEDAALDPAPSETGEPAFNVLGDDGGKQDR